MAGLLLKTKFGRSRAQALPSQYATIDPRTEQITTTGARLPGKINIVNGLVRFNRRENRQRQPRR